jgi:hypothetical protein
MKFAICHDSLWEISMKSSISSRREVVRDCPLNCMQAFRDVIDCGLSDYCYVGDKCTWHRAGI